MNKMRPVSRETIEVLNAAAAALLQFVEMQPVDACQTILPDTWELVSDDENTALYKTPAGLYVNLWTEGVTSNDIEPGGVGFDDQLDHYES